MEREEIFGAIIVLVIIVVVALIIFQLHGETGLEIRKIADEVFGWAKAEEEKRTVMAEEQESTKFLDRIKQIYEHSLNNQQADCTYSIKGHVLSERFRIELVYENNKETVMRLNLIKNEDDTLVSSKTIENKNGNWKKMPCFMISPTQREEANNRVSITYTEKEGLKAGTEEFYEDVPNFYKYDQNHLCFIKKIKRTALWGESSEDKYRNTFLAMKDCESTKVNADIKAEEFFTTFMAAIRRCMSFKKDEACFCEYIDFSNFVQGAEIRGTQEKEEVKFELYYNNKYIKEDSIQGVRAGNLNAGFFARKPTYKEWTAKPNVYRKGSEDAYITLTKGNQLAFATKRAATASGAFLRWAWAESLPQCNPSFYEVYESGCDRKLDPTLMIERMREGKYDTIIKKATKDENERELLAAIMAVESDVKNDAKKQKDSAGLMQFIESTAMGFSIECDKGTCYVCDPKGCKVQDNRANPEVAIPAGLKLLKQKIAAIDKCAGQTTFREVFGIASYNGGESVMCNAVKATGKKDPEWNDVKKQLTPSLLRQSKDYQSWKDADLKSKIKTIKCYPYYVQVYRTAFTKQFSDRITDKKAFFEEDLEDLQVLLTSCGYENNKVAAELETELNDLGMLAGVVGMTEEDICILPEVLAEELNKASKDSQLIVEINYDDHIEDDSTVIVEYKKDSTESIKLADEISASLKDYGLKPEVKASKEQFKDLIKQDKIIEVKTSKGNTKVAKPVAEAIAKREKLNVPPGCITNYDSYIERYAKESKIPVSLLKAVIKKESTFDPLAVSISGSAGLLQFSCSTGKEYFGSDRVTCCCKVDPGETLYTACKIEEKTKNIRWDATDAYLCNPLNDDRLNPLLSIKYGAEHLSDLFNAFSEIPNLEERYKFTMAAYNQGKGAVNEALKAARMSENINIGDLKTPGKWQTWEYTKKFMPEPGKSDVQNYVVKVQNYEGEFSKCPAVKPA